MSKHYLVVSDNSRMDIFLGLDERLPETVDCVVTSPPYQKDMGFSWTNTMEVSSILQTRLKGPLWLNFGDLAGRMNVAPRVAMVYEDHGFDWIQTIVWQKNHYTPFGGRKRFDSRHEYIYLLLPCGQKYELDRLAIGIPYKDKSNISRFGHQGDLKCPGTIWPIDYETIQSRDQKTHYHRYPVDLPRRCIKASNLKKDAWVLDPYVGSGTTMLAAKELGFNSIGFEYDKQHIDVVIDHLGGDVEVIE